MADIVVVRLTKEAEMVSRQFVSKRLFERFGEEKATELSLSKKSTMELARMADEDWIEHDGKGMPINGNEKVELIFRDWDTRVGRAGFWHGEGEMGESQWLWNPSDAELDIIAYRVVKENQDA